MSFQVLLNKIIKKLPSLSKTKKNILHNEVYQNAAFLTQLKECSSNPVGKNMKSRNMYVVETSIEESYALFSKDSHRNQTRIYDKINGQTVQEE